MAKKNDDKIAKEFESVLSYLKKVWVVMTSFLSDADKKDRNFKRLSKIEPPIDEDTVFSVWLKELTDDTDSQDELLDELNLVRELIKMCKLKPLKGNYLNLNSENRYLIDILRRDTKGFIGVAKECSVFLEVVTGKKDAHYKTEELWFESFIEGVERQLIRRQKADEPPVIE